MEFWYKLSGYKIVNQIEREKEKKIDTPLSPHQLFMSSAHPLTPNNKRTMTTGAKVERSRRAASWYGGASETDQTRGGDHSRLLRSLASDTVVFVTHTHRSIARQPSSVYQPSLTDKTLSRVMCGGTLRQLPVGAVHPDG